MIFLNLRKRIKVTLHVSDKRKSDTQMTYNIIGTPDSIFQVKSYLYDLLITLPSPSFHHPIKGNTKFQQNIALSEINSNQPHFKSSVISTKHNPADFTRFRIMWKQLMSSSSTSWAKYVASEPKDVFNTTAALVTGVYYWLYQEPHESSSSRFYSSWQNIFAGVNTRPNSNNQLPIFLNQTSTADESQNLLLDEDEEDAMEINNSQVFSVVAARASSEMYNSQDIDVLVKEDNEILLG